MATNRDGVIGFNEKVILSKKITIGTDTGNLPASDVRALAVDNRNQRIVPSLNTVSFKQGESANG
jgi:hypothetical protein